MSRFSGKCDLYDHIGMELMYDTGHSKVSDELECFEIFKKKTKGVIHQHLELELNQRNIDVEIAKVNNPQILSKKVFINDKGKEVTHYIYYNKEYNSLKQLNKVPYCTTIDIHFDTLLDIVPYYPYTIALAYVNQEEEYIVISDQSFVDSMMQDFLCHGIKSSTLDFYRSELQKHYIDVVNRYYNDSNPKLYL